MHLLMQECPGVVAISFSRTNVGTGLERGSLGASVVEEVCVSLYQDTIYDSLAS